METSTSHGPVATTISEKKISVTKDSVVRNINDRLSRQIFVQVLYQKKKIKILWSQSHKLEYS